MKKWFVVHDLIGYDRNNTVICYDAKRSIMQRFKSYFKKEENSRFFDIKKDDIIVYYAFGAGVIVGIFKVTSNNPYSFEDEYEKELLALKIEPLPYQNIKGSYLNFKKLLKRKAFQAFDLDKRIQEYFSILPDNYYEEIKKAFSDNSFLTKTKKSRGFGATGWLMDPDVICGVLDYYNGRATSFSSLFVASIFGLLTLAAIIQFVFSQNYNLVNDFFVFVCSGFLYIFFILASYHTLKTYFHYTGIADKVKYLALDIPYKKDFESVWGAEAKDNRIVETNLARIISGKEKSYSNSLLKRVMKHNKLFVIGYALSLFALTIVIYWKLLPQLYAIVASYW